MSEDNNFTQAEVLAMSLKILSDAVMTYINFERGLEENKITRVELEMIAKERGVYYTDETSDWNLFEGIRSSFRADLLRINAAIQAKITFIE